MAAVLVVTQFLFPGTGGNRGTPAAILFRGTLIGLVGSLTAAGLVLIYRTLRFINFAQSVIGVVGGTLTFNLIQFTKVPFLLALLAGLAVTALLGFVFGIVSLRFSRAPRLVLTVLTIVAIPIVTSAVPFIDRLGIFPPSETRTLSELTGEAIRFAVPFAGFQFRIGNFPIRFGYPDIFAGQVAIVVLLGVGAFLRYTRLGVAMRAVGENAERASLLGIGFGWITLAMWAIAGALAGAGTILSALTLPTPASVVTGVAPEILLPALAAAVIGRMRSLPVTVAASIGIAVVSASWSWSFRDDTPLFTVVLLVIIAGGLLLLGRRQLDRVASSEAASSWAASAEQRPIPEALRSIPVVRFTRIALIAIGVVVLAVYPFAVSTGATVLGSQIALQAIAVLSLVVLTGWAGQVSLGQWAFVALGAVLGGALSGRLGVPFWFAVPAATVLVAAFAALIGLPALRIRGLFLSVVTFAFAIASTAVLFNERYFGWLLPKSVQRPTAFFVDFSDERSMYFLCVGALVLAIAMVTSLRRTRIGRNLIALRDNEAGVRSFGIPAVRTKLLAFAIAGGLAGFAGAIFAHQQRGVSAGSFGAEANLQIFTTAVFGGVGSAGGALLGSAYFNAVAYFSSSAVIRAFAGPFLTIALLYASPGGLISLVNTLRDSILSIVAERRRVVVPGLDRDFEPGAPDVTPLAEPAPGTGLAALRTTRRFAMTSGMHADTGRDRGADPGRLAEREEAAVIASAAADEGTGRT